MDPELAANRGVGTDYVENMGREEDEESSLVSDDEAEKEHFQYILTAYLQYKPQALARILRSELFLSSLPTSHQRRLIQYSAGLTRARQCVVANADIIDLILHDADDIFENVPRHHTPISTPSSVPTPEDFYKYITVKTDAKVTVVLKQLERDWSSAGASERSQSYGPLLDALVEVFPRPHGVSVLVPGAGLGRLAYEVAMRGYNCQGNDFSLFMLLASNFVLNKCHTVHEHTIYPWVHQFVNNLSMEDQTRPVTFPDVNPASLSTKNFSMTAGDFSTVYSHAEEWDCVITCFFIDCAPNVISFVEIIYNILKPGGVWINLGPLLYHYSETLVNHSIEPPLDILCDIIQDVGFTIEKWKTGVQTKYCQSPVSMVQTEYASVFLVCRKPGFHQVTSGAPPVLEGPA